MKKLYATIIIILLAIPAFAQYYPPSIQWQKAFGTSGVDHFNLVKPTSDGGYIAAGRTNGNDFDVNDNHGGFDALVVKYNSIGNLEWKKCYGGTLDDEALSVLEVPGGGFIVTGYASSTNGDITENKGFNDAWIFKINSLGIIEWLRTYGSTGGDSFRQVQLTSDGGYIVAGGCGANNGDVIGSGYKGGGQDVWVIKLNSIGLIEWKKAYGSTNAEIANSIQITNDGGFIIAGNTNGNDGDVNGLHAGGPNPFRRDMWVVKLDSAGALQWQKCLGGENAVSPSGTAEEEAYAVEQSNDGGYIIAGYTSSIDGDVTNYHGGIRDGWIIKLSSTGSLLWQKTIGGSSDDYIWNMIKHPDGGYVMCGYTASGDGDLFGQPLRANIDAWVIKIDSLGNIQWQRMLRTSGIDGAFSIAITPGDGFIVGGYASFNDLDAAGNPYWGTNPNAWIVKLSPQVLPLTLTDFKITQTNQGIILKWQTANEVNFSHFEIERSIDGNTFNAISTVSAIPTASSIKFYAYTDEDHPSVSKLFYRLRMMDKDGSYFYSSVISISPGERTTISVFPNPANGLIFIRSDKTVKTATVMDTGGRICLTKKGEDIKTLDISTLPGGTYYVQILDTREGIKVLPFIKK